MKHFDTVTVSKVGQSTLPKWWRDVSGLSQGGIVEVRPLHDGQNSIVLTPESGPAVIFLAENCVSNFPAVRGRCLLRLDIDYHSK